MRLGERTRDLEGLLEALVEAVGKACAKDPQLKPLLAQVRSCGMEVRLLLQVRVGRAGSRGITVEAELPWSRQWNREDAELLHSLGIALEGDDRELFPPEPNGPSPR
ncbi:MAG: hypothetical protein NZ869_05155 [Thermoanaerobaculum sp.]|nr:hypothetical protein [Thermoanaerobaculum sp.]MCX7896043.1 hypothetical protein [Thermoanaerobaculum sp.]MDW7968128.1 hypothetical protein [Thermoanaerobaculum sp.]